jgi:poly(3-hydroxyoctanoate) depolymerase
MADDERVLVNGVRARVEVRGAGPPLLLVMGIWGDLRGWDRLLAHLNGFRTIAFDAPGIGGTEVPLYASYGGSHAAFAAGVLDAVGVRRAHVLGVSLGGVVAHQLAVLAPHRVSRLVLVSTSSAALHLPGRPGPMMRLLAPRGTLDGLGRDAGEVFGGRLRRNPELLSDLNLTPPRNAAAYLRRLSALADWWGLPWRVRQPTLVVTGDDDPIVPAANSRVLARWLPDARLHVVPGGGHLVAFDSPERVGPVVAEFLARSGPARIGTLAA